MRTVQLEDRDPRTVSGGIDGGGLDLGSHEGK